MLDRVIFNETVAQQSAKCAVVIEGIGDRWVDRNDRCESHMTGFASIHLQCAFMHLQTGSQVSVPK